MRLRGRALLMAITIFCAAGVRADDMAPERATAGTLLFGMQEGYRVATSLNTDVAMTINGHVARVKVRQQFENGGSTWAEGVYVFPLPDAAAVDRMRLTVGERLIESEIREKAVARKAYERAREAGRKASLVEQQRPNLFTTSVANVAPGERVVVEIEYLEDLEYDAGRFSLRFPMTLTPRYMPGDPLPDRQGSGWSADTTSVGDASSISPPMVSASNAHRASIRIDLDAGLPLATITSRYHPVDVVERQGRYAIELAGPSVRMDHDFVLDWQPATGAAPQAAAFAESMADERYYLLMVTPPSVAANADGMLRETIFIIDTSGSMHGTSIRQAKRALARALKRLRAGDRFNVIAFSSQPRRLFEESVTVAPGTVANAETFVAALQANGGTEMRAALSLALDRPAAETHLRQLVFITDGAVGNEDELFRLIEHKLGGARLFTVGIGSAPNSWFMRKAAETGRGAYTMIGALHDVGEKMERLFEKIERPQVTNIALDWPAGVTVDAYPPVVPDLYSDEPVTVRVKITGRLRPTDVVGIRGDTINGAWSRELALGQDRQSPGVAALWARARIGALTDEELRGRDADEVRGLIVATALKYHLVSKFTSLVAVDRTPSRAAGERMRRDQVPNLMAHGQSRAAIFGFPATATPAGRLQIQGVACILLSLAVLFAGRARRASRRVR